MTHKFKLLLFFGIFFGFSQDMTFTAQAQTAVTHDFTGNRSSEVSNQPVTTPIITGQPQTLLGQIGGTYQFSVVATGLNLNYQWYKDTTAISGATTSTFVISNAQSSSFTNNSASTGFYSVQISNSAGTVTSNSVALYLDSDGVGIPDWWQQQYFGTVGINPGAYTNGNTVTNLQAYLDGTNPTVPSSSNYTLTTSGPVTVQPGQTTYAHGSAVTLAVNGALLQNWTGNASGSSNPLSITMSGNKSIQAVTTDFVNAHFPVTLSSTGNAYVRSLLVQTNGEIVAGGAFDTFLGSPQWNLGRITSNGTLDSTSFPGTQSRFQSTISGMVQQADGKVIVVGSFYHSTPMLGANPPNYIARLNADGTLDESFMASGQYPNGSVYAVAVQSNGQIVIAGSFSEIGTTASNGLARLNTDGTIDTTFNVGSGLSGTVSPGCLQIDSNGNIYVGGYLTYYNGTSISDVIRVTSTGGLDTSFSTGTGFNSQVTAIALHPSGGLYVGGYFTTYQGTAANEIVALTNTGAIDGTFNAGTASSSGTVYQISLQGNGQLLLACSSSYWQGQTRSYALRLNASGSVDSSFSPTLNGYAYTIAQESSGKIVVGGEFSSVNGATRDNLVQLNSNGTLDTPVYNVGSATSSNYNDVCAQQSNGEILVAGSFTLVNNVSVPGFARLNTNGSLDTTFNQGTGPNSTVYTIVPLPSGNTVIGGAFSTYNGSSAPRLAELNSDGTLNTAFGANEGTGPDSTVNGATVQTNGQIVIVGSFQHFNGQPRSYIARINTNGTLDSSFTPSANSTVNAVAVAVDAQGKIVIGGTFTDVDGDNMGYFLRLNSDGSVDSTFNPPMPNGMVSGIAMSPTGQIVIRGSFTKIGNTPQYGLARFSSTGTLDPVPGYNNLPTIQAMGVQADGSIVLGSNSTFTSSGVNYPYLFRLNASGAIDPSFNPGPTSSVTSLLIASNNDIYALGNFNTDLSEYASGIARYSSAPNLNLMFSGTNPSGPVTAGTPIQLYGTAATVTGNVADVEFLYSTDGVNFQTASAGTSQGSGLYTGVWAPPAAATYYLKMTASDSLGESTGSSLVTYTATSGSPQIGAPAVSVASGTYTSPQTIGVSSSSPGVQIFYTTDGSNPASSPTRIFLGTGGTITVSQTTTLNLETFYASGSSSETTATYTINSGQPQMASSGEPLPGWVMPVLAGLFVYFASRKKTPLAS